MRHRGWGGPVAALGLGLIALSRAAIAEPAHYVVFEGLKDGYSSRYTLVATGAIAKADGELGGIPVVADAQDRIDAQTVDGTVWADADGFRIQGGIERIAIEKPENVQVHIGRVASTEAAAGCLIGGGTQASCHKRVSATAVKVLAAQEDGEGRLELRFEHRLGDMTEKENAVVAENESRKLKTRFEALPLANGTRKTLRLTTKVWEEERPRDWSTGKTDYGESSRDVTLRCGRTLRVVNEVTIKAEEEPDAKVRVAYEIKDAADE